MAKYCSFCGGKIGFWKPAFWIGSKLSCESCYKKFDDLENTLDSASYDQQKSIIKSIIKETRSNQDILDEFDKKYQISRKETEKFGPFSGPIIYSVDGARGRHIDVYTDKCVITTVTTFGSLLTDSATNGEKTIYFVDCVGIQFKKAGLTLGYLQIETPSGNTNNIQNNFFNENSFTYETDNIPNGKMEEIALYIKDRISKIKDNNQAGKAINITPADEILKYKKLLDIGAITSDEYNAKKKQLLNL